MNHIARPGQGFCKNCALPKEGWPEHSCKGNQMKLDLNKKPPVALDLLNGDKPKINRIKIRLKAGSQYIDIPAYDLIGMKYKGYQVVCVEDVFAAGSTEYYRELVLKR